MTIASIRSLLRLVFPAVWLLFLTMGIPARAEDRAQAVTFSVEVDFGRDLGQSFGSLFETRNAAGRVVAGAGFADVYNTRFWTGRHTLQFFVRPPSGHQDFTVERLAHPNLDCGVYLCEDRQQLYAWSSVRGTTVRRLDDMRGTSRLR